MDSFRNPFRSGAGNGVPHPPPAPAAIPESRPWIPPQQAAPPPPEGFPPQQPPLQEAPRRGHTRWWWISRSLALALLLFILLVGWLAITAPLSKSLEPIVPPQITLLASDGTPIARNGAEVADPVEIRKLPEHVPQAFIAIEDRRFRSHWGLDLRGMARAVFNNVFGTGTQGGSTITQQLAKFTFLTPERSLTRKAREALIALWLETWLTKDEILERYLSNAYFGDNTYGLRAASMHYFYRRPEKLTPAQAAMLAGLVQAPSRLAPTRNPALAAKRMKLVTAAMLREGYLTAAQARAMKPPALDVRGKRDLPTGTYFADWALPAARRLSDVSYARQTLTTTLDARLQAAAHRAIARAPLGKAQVALVAMRPNGEVVAMVGGRRYADSPFNRVSQARRQPGSTFKLFVYLTALQNGWEPGDTIPNGPFQTGHYRPKNFAERYSDQITLEDAFARSSNVAAVRLFNQVGDQAVIKTARDLGVTSPLAKGDPSLALGTSTMTLLELTAAYAAVAADSYPVVPRAFPADEQSWGDWLFSGQKSLGSGTRDAMRQMMAKAVSSGTGRAAALRMPAFGKTGTSQESRDALFIGYAGDLVVGVWIGNDDNTPLAGASGGGVPARIWRDFMIQAHGAKAAPPPRRVNPSGPVQPLDIRVPDILPSGAVPIGGNSNLRIENGGAIFSTDVGGVPIDLRIDPEGIRASTERITREAQRLREQNEAGIAAAQAEQRRAAEAARAAGARLTEQIREAGRRAEQEIRRQQGQ